MVFSIALFNRARAGGFRCCGGKVQGEPLAAAGGVVVFWLLIPADRSIANGCICVGWSPELIPFSFLAWVSFLTLIGRSLVGLGEPWIAPIALLLPIGLTLVPVKSWQDWRCLRWVPFTGQFRPLTSLTPGGRNRVQSDCRPHGEFYLPRSYVALHGNTSTGNGPG